MIIPKQTKKWIRMGIKGIVVRHQGAASTNSHYPPYKALMKNQQMKKKEKKKRKNQIRIAKKKGERKEIEMFLISDRLSIVLKPEEGEALENRVENIQVGRKEL